MKTPTVKGSGSIVVCRPKSLPLEKMALAERRAVDVNPDNAVERRSIMRTPIGRKGGPSRIAVLTARKWPSTGVRLGVSFLDSPSASLRTRILAHMNAWGEFANVQFAQTNGQGEVRIARLDAPEELAGYWSYIGTEILEIESDQPTMNLQGFTMTVSEAEFRRVVRHEAGHTLGFEHEHMRSDLVSQIDPKKAIAYFGRGQGWPPHEVEAQVLTPLSKKSIMGTLESDPLSIMCYQLPASIMKKGRKAIAGGRDINPKDAAFAAKLYPKRPEVSSTPQPLAARREPSAAAERFDLRTDADAFHLMILDEFDEDGGQRGGSEKRADFARVVASYGGARVISSMRLRRGGSPQARARRDRDDRGTAFGRIIGMHERIRAYTNRDRGSLPSDKELLDFGEDLFETLFEGDVRRLYDEARVRERRRLDFVLTSMIPWIAEKPWEFAFDRGRRTFLATEETQFVRNVLTNIPSDAIQPMRGPLRILVAAAQPIGLGRLSIEQEVAVIRRGFQPLVDGGHVEIDVIARASPRELHGYLSTGTYQVAHFIGHGIYDEQRQEGCLIFEDDAGRQYPLGERDARAIFCGRGLSLVFLNACESGRGGRSDFNKGIAQSFVQHGLPAVVANQYTVLDSSATAFAKHFYWSLAQGMSIGQAARESRIAVNYSLRGQSIDWAIPVVYARDANRTLCSPPPLTDRNRVPATSVRPGSRRAISGREIRVGVWDIDDVFPFLEKSLDAMNAAQDVYGFELVDLSIPVDSWDLNASTNTRRLVAERFAGQLRSRPSELRVDLLICVTRHWMDGAGSRNIYAWWCGDPIALFSVAGFEELQPSGLETDRVVSNILVELIAGYFGDMGSHDNGRACPFWYNEDRDFSYLSGAHHFDAACRRKLKAAIGAKLPALDALLKLFQESLDA